MTTTIEKAERDLNNLEEQREALFSRAKLLSKQRDQIAFAALTAGDKQSKVKLSEYWMISIISDRKPDRDAV
jgi:hypothetical protein